MNIKKYQLLYLMIYNKIIFLLTLSVTGFLYNYKILVHYYLKYNQYYNAIWPKNVIYESIDDDDYIINLCNKYLLEI